MSFRKRSPMVLAAGAAAVLALTLAGCSSASSGAGTSPSTSAAPVSGAAAKEVAAAKATLAQYATAPTTIAQTDALPSAPAKGKTFVWLNCDIPSCTNQSIGMKAAMKLAGWNYKQINYQSANPATLTAAFKQALALKPTVVAESGVPPEAGWSSILPAYKAAGIPIITAFLGPTTIADPIIVNVNGPTVFDEYAKLVAAWFIADSGAHGKALIERVDAYPVLKAYSDSLVKYIKAGCSACDISTVLQNSATDAATAKIVPSTISALKRDSGIQYFLPCDLEFFDALPSALSAANLKVKVAAQSPDLAALGYLKSGKFSMSSSHPLEQAGWVIADAAFRYTMKLPLTQDSGVMPTWVLEPGKDFPTDKLQEYPTDFASQFAKLWHLS